MMHIREIFVALSSARMTEVWISFNEDQAIHSLQEPNSSKKLHIAALGQLRIMYGNLKSANRIVEDNTRCPRMNKWSIATYCAGRAFGRS